mmetsp:Transcript_22959/g.65245  ORF Transcript_22959/g.65245 Transcript_22959/m.65245 type:complete len:222 (+) Transcript_22959:144-809(+)
MVPKPPMTRLITQHVLLSMTFFHCMDAGSWSAFSIITVSPRKLMPPFSSMALTASFRACSVRKMTKAWAVETRPSRDSLMGVFGPSSAAPEMMSCVSEPKTLFSTCWKAQHCSRSFAASSGSASPVSFSSGSLRSVRRSARSLANWSMTSSSISLKSQAMETPTTSFPVASAMAAFSSSSTRSQPFISGKPKHLAQKSLCVKLSSSMIWKRRRCRMLSVTK